MTSIKTVIFIAIQLCYASYVSAQEVHIPTFNDRYTSYIRQLEQGKTDIDYTDFRNSFIASRQFDKKGTEYDSLKRQVFSEIKNKNYRGVISVTKAMLGIDYTSMFAHMYLQKTYAILGDSVNRNKYRDIEFGLINSIVKKSDGLSCETGWHVTQIEEEYFIINIVLGAEFESQSISNGGKNICDKMTVKTEEGHIKTYFFEANMIFEMENKLLGK
ncbi:MAG: DUF4919 domain-containing protein [Chitinophagaceae bacterium]|nr:DUF4919 domain-containing protein [Chitinophagaceae bacterium]